LLDNSSFLVLPDAGAHPPPASFCAERSAVAESTPEHLPPRGKGLAGVDPATARRMTG